MLFHALSAYMLKRMSAAIPRQQRAVSARAAAAYRRRVARNVAAAMRASGYSQNRLAPRMGFTQQALSRRLTGLVAFDVDELAMLARLLNTSVESLVKRGR